MNETALDRFLRYVAIDTQSSEESNTYPSTEKQLVLLRLLAEELRGLGLSDVTLDQWGYVMATLPGNIPRDSPEYGKVPVIGWIAHVDTSPSVSGANVKPQVMEYRGGDVILPGDPSIIIREAENPELNLNRGKIIVTSDGTTLLGADDKAGIAIIMTAVQELLNDPQLPHGDIRIGFTPDEEVGAGTKYFDIQKFGAQFAYTVDGDTAGELNKETFSADSAIITVHGRNIHPGTAKGIMVNSIRAMGDIIVRMPQDIAPETTEGYEPYIHPHQLQGEEEKSTLKILLRDFNTSGLADLRKMLEDIIEEVKPLHPKTTIELEIIESYRNMREGLENDPRVLECLWEAVQRAGLEPKWVPIRGGTDGSRLTAAGLPTPNIFTGGKNFHSKTEWVSVSDMESSVKTLLHLAQIWVEKSRL
ncbi:MAG: peptidase T [Acidobacteriota bacterium]|jgi:tripeptide aminopeptidase|nr:peptidase T [Acidobacteriota bacterium]